MHVISNIFKSWIFQNVFSHEDKTSNNCRILTIACHKIEDCDNFSRHLYDKQPPRVSLKHPSCNTR